MKMSDVRQHKVLRLGAWGFQIRNGRVPGDPISLSERLGDRELLFVCDVAVLAALTRGGRRTFNVCRMSACGWNCHIMAETGTCWITGRASCIGLDGSL